jgi:WXXGXW repeat (2 copies)
MMNHVGGPYTAVGSGKTETGISWSEQERRNSRATGLRRNITRLGLGLLLVWGFAGCHKNTTASASAMDQNGGPANGNLAPVNDSATYSTAPPARVLGQNVQYQVQQQGEDYAPQQGAPIERSGPYAGDPNNYDQQADNQQAEDVYQSDLTDAEAQEPPPPLPYYDQPPAPDPDYLWTPGYWAWGPEGYYWVPGCWVAAPYTGALWTPGYWGFLGGRYRFHRGFWGLHIGFYGGIDYGFGYTGHGYYGGYWDHDHFRYNTAVNRVDDRVIRNVYVRNVVVNNVVVNNRIVNRTSFNGGRGGVDARPLVAEAAVLHEQRHAPMASQIQVEREASQNRQQFFNQNRGRPAVVANVRPVVADRAPSAVLPRAAGPAVQPAPRGDMRQGQAQPQYQGRQGQPQGQPQVEGRQVQPQPGQAQPDFRRGQPQAQPDVRQVQPQPGQAQPVFRRGQPQQVQPQPQSAQPQLQPQFRRGQPQQVQPQQVQPQPQPAQPQPDFRRGQPQGQPRPEVRQPQQVQPQPQTQPQVKQAPPQPEFRRQQQQPSPQPQSQLRQVPPSQPQPQVRQAPPPQPQPQVRQASPPPQARPAAAPAPAQHPQPQGEEHGKDNPHR